MAQGRFIGRGDLVYRHWRVIVEYDGDQHRTDTTQFDRDVRRLDDFAANGWRVVRIVGRSLLRRPGGLPGPGRRVPCGEAGWNGVIHMPVSVPASGPTKHPKAGMSAEVMLMLLADARLPTGAHTQSAGPGTGAPGGPAGRVDARLHPGPAAHRHHASRPAPPCWLAAEP